ncbi:MAG: SDR family NAD(P)-dependent oxidoreductase [Ignavibacteriaceae bacterium]|nr:SDR family NAD(P)-dependent oxidoreductase [Ignavibacteriaceae bacterium]
MKKELLIFGSEGDLGKGVKTVLSQKGFNKIYLFDRNLESKTNGNIEHIKIKDLSVEDNVILAFSYLKPDKDCFYYLFSSIGGFYGGLPIWETKIEDWERMFNINLNSNFLIAKHFSILVKASAGGAICFTSAYTAKNQEAFKGAYGASKSALVHFVKTLALEGKQINLSAACILPYIIDTPSNRKWMPNSDFNSWVTPEEIGEVVYLILMEARYFSGNAIELKNKIT